MNCAFCGLETGSPASHERQEACIEALRLQVSELKSVLQHTRNPGEEPLRPSARIPEPTMMGGFDGRNRTG